MFLSNTEMAKCYLKECLSDENEHSREELLKYVLSKTNGIDISGKELSEAVINSALWSMCKVENVCENTRRGIYISADIGIYSDMAPAFQRVSKIAEKARDDIDNCFVVDIIKLEISDEELLTAQKYAEKITGLLQEIGQVSEEAIAEINELNTEEDSSMQMT